MSDDWTPLGGWEPDLDSVVVDQRRDTEGARGTVIRCDRYGHFADPYWRASVRWDQGGVEHNISTVWLTREDGTQ